MQRKVSGSYYHWNIALRALIKPFGSNLAGATRIIDSLNTHYAKTVKYVILFTEAR